MHNYYVYILASKKNGTLYIGITFNLLKRVYEHKNSLVPSFSKRYKIYNLVYYEQFDNLAEARLRERRLKKWKREWKIKLIEDFNPGWKDLYKSLF